MVEENVFHAVLDGRGIQGLRAHPCVRVEGAHRRVIYMRKGQIASMKYFAYGSNMLTERLTRRVPNARCLGVARVPGRRLAFHKQSVDKSGKCDLPKTGNNSDVAYGVLFDIPDFASRLHRIHCRDQISYRPDAEPQDSP